MLESHHLQEDGSFRDPNSWLSQDHHHSSSSNAHPSNGNFDHVLFRNLVEMVPLVESLMDRRSNTTYSRRASLNYTRTPSRESFPRRIADQKGRKIAQTNPSKKRRDFGNGDLSKIMSRDNQDGCADDFSVFSSSSLAVERDREELITLREQVENLQKKLLEKDEALKIAENSLNQMSSVHARLDELKQQVTEKDLSLRSAHMQLSDVKIKLADKQAALEKSEWETMISNRKVEKLQEDLGSMQNEIASFMRVFKELMKSDSATTATTYAQEKDTYFHPLNQLPQIEPVDEIEMQKMEEAQMEYISAVAVAKKYPSEESLAGAAEARLKLQAFCREKGEEEGEGRKKERKEKEESHLGGVCRWVCGSPSRLISFISSSPSQDADDIPLPPSPLSSPASQLIAPSSFPSPCHQPPSHPIRSPHASPLSARGPSLSLIHLHLHGEWNANLEKQ
ncbi:restin [Cinnamomum micranthum f. kanehirae]|uniref:Restin n=1 Tax=Cinnamomum micranthum f. kanehirae TaxID=337451 RepID=A0A3S3PP79_9MAGN|nr:restin [Cinnamomum micranthum f. kanehirae]